MDSALFESIASRIDLDRTIGHLVRLIQTPSVNPFDRSLGTDEGEDAVGEYIREHLASLGWDTDAAEVLDGRSNVWGTLRGGDGPTVALAGHTDTVGVIGYDDPFSGEQRGGRVYGRGACDMKAALAAYLEVATLLTETANPLAGNLIVAGISDEECGMLGSEHFGAEGPHLDYVIIGEPTDLEVCTAHLGQLTLTIRTFGRAVHSSRPELGVNAIDQMAKVLEALGRYRSDLASAPGHPFYGLGRISPGVIRGGDMVAIVPDYCELEVDRRSLPGETPEQIIAEIRSYLDPLTLDEDFRYELSEPDWIFNALETDLDSPVVLAVQQAVEGVGLSSCPAVCSGTTDGPNLGAPTVICGPGSLSQAHTVDEYVPIDQVAQAVRVYLSAVLSLLS